MAEVSEVIDKQIELEEQAQKKLMETVKLVEDAWAISILDSIRMDSTKHAYLLRSLKKALTQRLGGSYDDRLTRFVDPLAARKAFEEHLALEENMLKRFYDLAKRVSEEKTQAVLLQLVEEEKRHHKAIEDLLKDIYGLRVRRQG